jgi:hypothetical protein
VCRGIIVYESGFGYLPQSGFVQQVAASEVAKLPSFVQKDRTKAANFTTPLSKAL